MDSRLPPEAACGRLPPEGATADRRSRIRGVRSMKTFRHD